METNQYLIDAYNNGDEDGRLTRKFASVEFLTTMRYIEKYLKSGDKILEIGAATGRYAHALARSGYEVAAVELVEKHIEIFKQNTQPGEKITISQGNAMDLSGFPDDTYDITLLLGPLYHLYNKQDKLQTLREAIRVTKRGGIIFAAYIIADGCILDMGFKRGGFSVADYIARGLIDPETFATHSKPEDLFELVRKEDIADLMSCFAVTRLHYLASDGYAERMHEAVDAMDDATFELYLKYHFATCEREDLIGMTSHSLDIFRKN